MHHYDRSKRGRQFAGRSRSHKAPVAEDVPTDFPPAKGPLLRTLTRDDLPVEDSIDKVGIANCQVIASYNWLAGASATILCPGAPPRWTPPISPVTLKQDDGQYFRDMNAAHFSKFPMEPAVRASMQMSADFDLKSIELCACSSTLGSLLRFARDVKKPFRFWVEVVGNTAFFIRKERSPKQLIENVWGYGHTFPEAYTTWPQAARKSVSHQRILSYNLAGMKLLVRFEGDGYLDNFIDGTTRQAVGTSGGEDDQLESAMSDLLRKDGDGPTDGKLTLETGGSLVTQQAIFDLKTRSIKKKDQDILSEECPRLWLSQIPNMILAFHSYGKFESINVKKVTEDVQCWEKSNQNDLKRFTSLARLIVKEATQTGAKKLEVRATIEGKLEMRDLGMEEWSALPPDLKQYWTSSQQDISKEKHQKHDDIHGGKTPIRNNMLPWLDIGSDDNDSKDYTACSKDCGYCGRCPY